MKKACITPLLKNENDSENPANYRPISQLPFFSKILERTVSNQISTFFEANSTFNQFQSAYIRGRSTETAITVVSNDIITNNCTLLVLLDMSAAFDTLNHYVIINRLHQIGIRNSALDWFKSY